MAKLTLDQVRQALNPEIRPYDRDTFLWQPDSSAAIQEQILVKDLTALHLANIINWIEDHPHWYDDGVRDFMIEESKLRQLPAFANNEPIIRCGKDGRYFVTEPE